MPCSACGYATAADATFCARCGAALASACPACGAPNGVEPYRTALALSFLGDVHLERGEAGQAVAVLERAVEQADQYRSRQVRSWFRSLLAEACRRAGRHDEARALATQARAMANETRFAWGMALATQVLVRIELSAGRPAEARVLADEALRGFAGIDARWDVASARSDLALLACFEGRADDSRAALSEARAGFRALGVQQIEKRIERLARTFPTSPAVDPAG